MKYSLQELNRFLNIYPIELQETILEIRNLVFKCAPDAHEQILHGGLSYLKIEGGGPVKDGICQIHVRDNAVRLAFIHGSFLPDPMGLLRGDRKAKRYVEIRSMEEAPWSALQELIQASVTFDPRTIS